MEMFGDPGLADGLRLLHALALTGTFPFLRWHELHHTEDARDQNGQLGNPDSECDVVVKSLVPRSVLLEASEHGRVVLGVTPFLRRECGWWRQTGRRRGEGHGRLRVTE